MNKIFTLLFFSLLITITGCFDNSNSGSDNINVVDNSEAIIGVWASAGTIEKSLEGDSLVDESDFYNPLDDDYRHSVIKTFEPYGKVIRQSFDDDSIYTYNGKYKIIDSTITFYDKTIGDSTAEEMSLVIRNDSMFLVFDWYDRQMVNADVYISYPDSMLPASWK